MQQAPIRDPGEQYWVWRLSAIAVVAWHTLFDELELRQETVGAQRLAPDSMIKSIPQF